MICIHCTIDLRFGGYRNLQERARSQQIQHLPQFYARADQTIRFRRFQSSGNTMQVHLIEQRLKAKANDNKAEMNKY